MLLPFWQTSSSRLTLLSDKNENSTATPHLESCCQTRMLSGTAFRSHKTVFRACRTTLWSCCGTLFWWMSRPWRVYFSALRYDGAAQSARTFPREYRSDYSDWNEPAGRPRLVGCTRGLVKKALLMCWAILSGQVVPGEVTRSKCAITVSTPKTFSLWPSGSDSNSDRVRNAAVGAGTKDLFHRRP